MMWKIQQAMQDDAIRTARIHPAFIRSNRDEVFIWQKSKPAEISETKHPAPSHINTSKILQRI